MEPVSSCLVILKANLLFSVVCCLFYLVHNVLPAGNACHSTKPLSKVPPRLFPALTQAPKTKQLWTHKAFSTWHPSPCSLPVCGHLWGHSWLPPVGSLSHSLPHTAPSRSWSSWAFSVVSCVVDNDHVYDVMMFPPWTSYSLLCIQDSAGQYKPDCITSIHNPATHPHWSRILPTMYSSDPHTPVPRVISRFTTLHPYPVIQSRLKCFFPQPAEIRRVRMHLALTPPAGLSKAFVFAFSS